jgi:hypothetical protein
MKFHLSSLIVATLCSSAFAAESPTMRSLFNGKDLTGWTGDGYIVEDGAIVCTPQGTNLVSEQTFSAYVLEFDFKLPPGGNNGLGIHYPGTGDGAYTGMELQILDNTAPQYADLKEYQFHGSLYTMAAAKKTGLKPVGEWNHQRVTVAGSNIYVELNGQAILHAKLDELEKAHPDHAGVKRRAGHIAWLGHGDRVAFKNIKIGEIPPAANKEGVIAAGYKPLFNGENLDGWKHGDTKEWYVSNGILKHTGKAGNPSDLWTEKSYGDTTLVFDWRWSGRGPVRNQPIVLPDGTYKTGADGKPETAAIEELDSGIYLRGNDRSQVNLWNWTVGSGEVYGYRTNPGMSAEVRAGVTPSAKADRPLGEWNRTMITIKGDRLTVTLNDRKVIDNAQLPDVPKTGAIGLQHHGAAIDFANIWIKEL